MKIWQYVASVSAILLGLFSSTAFAQNVMGAGIGATTGGSTITSTTQQPDDNGMSGTANTGNAIVTDGVISSTSPSQEGMVAPDYTNNPDKNAKDTYKRQ